MDHETVSRKEKIEMARRLVKSGNSGSTRHREIKTAGTAEKEVTGGRFFLRLLLSVFIFLAVLGVTEFEAMGEEKAAEYKTGIEKVLRTQRGLEKMKAFIRS